MSAAEGVAWIVVDLSVPLGSHANILGYADGRCFVGIDDDDRATDSGTLERELATSNSCLGG
jgi:hypothetical protein